MISSIKTDPALLVRLAASTKTKPSDERLRKQRVSFIYGALPMKSTITHAQIEATLDRLEGIAA